MMRDPRGGRPPGSFRELLDSAARLVRELDASARDWLADVEDAARRRWPVERDRLARWRRAAESTVALWWTATAAALTRWRRAAAATLRRWWDGAAPRLRRWHQTSGARLRGWHQTTGARLRGWRQGVGSWLGGSGARLDRLGRRFAAAASAGWDRAGPRLASVGASLGGAWQRAVPRLRAASRRLRAWRPSWRQVAFVLTLLLIGGWALWERCGLDGCPDVERLTSYQPGGASVLLDRHGERFADLAPMEYEVVPLDSLPAHVPAAFVAVEDRRFYDHRGVDWRRVVGAAWADLRAGGFVEGSSTIPMQLSRTLFPDRIRREEKTLRRKLLEARVAKAIEARFTKREILELYLNHVYLGAGAYGVQAASRYYFGKDAQSLALEEAALLAALPRAPSHYDPRRNEDAARARRDLVLTLMERQRLVAFREAEPARARGLGVAPEPVRDPDGERLAPYFVEHVRRILEAELGEALYARPHRILTTLDPSLQAAAEAQLASQLRAVERGVFGWYGGPGADEAGGLQGAVVVMDVQGGEIRAWVGGREYDRSRYDRARLARRQVGSAFKPFVYGAALEAGFPPSQPILDAPYILASGGGREWRPENYSGRFEGPMSMREALVRSQNVPAVRLAAALGDARVRDFARRAGLGGEVPGTPVAALGVTSASPLEMTVAYASIAGLGVRPSPRFVLRVEDPDGTVLLATEPERAAALDPAVAFVLGDMLRDVVDRGTGAGVRRAGFYAPAAGKTGTTNNATDVWFIGFTPELVGTVWVGHDEVRPLPGRATGGGIAAPVWGGMMARARGGRGPDWPTAPRDVVLGRIDPETGMILEEGCRPRYDSPRRELFLARAEPARICPTRRSRDYDDGFGGWLGRVFGGHDPAPQIPGPSDPELGMPRLPLRDGSVPGPPQAERPGARRPAGPLGRPIGAGPG